MCVCVCTAGKRVCVCCGQVCVCAAGKHVCVHVHVFALTRYVYESMRVFVYMCACMSLLVPRPHVSRQNSAVLFAPLCVVTFCACVCVLLYVWAPGSGFGVITATR